MKNSIRVAFLFVLVTMAGRAAVVLDSSCAASFLTVTASAVGSGFCSASVLEGGDAPGAAATASISGQEMLPPIDSPASPASVSYSFATSVIGLVGGVNAASANVSGSDALVLDTAGPVRSGELVFTEATSLGGLDSTLTTMVTVGSLSGGCTELANLPPTCTGSLGLANGNGTMTAPFTLGEPFDFDFSISAGESLGSGTDHFGNGSASFSFQLFESDGTTPVQVLTPEPSTFGILACGLMAVVVAVLKRACERA